MSTIAGASRYLTQATLSAKTGSTFSTPNLLESVGISSVLDVAQKNSNGIGLSASARQLNAQLLKSNASTANGLFSMTGGVSASVDNSLLQINGLRAKLPASQIHPSVKGTEVDQTVDGTSAGSATTGTAVDTEV